MEYLTFMLKEMRIYLITPLEKGIMLHNLKRLILLNNIINFLVKIMLILLLLFLW